MDRVAGSLDINPNQTGIHPPMGKLHKNLKSLITTWSHLPKSLVTAFDRKQSHSHISCPTGGGSFFENRDRYPLSTAAIEAASPAAPTPIMAT